MRVLRIRDGQIHFAVVAPGVSPSIRRTDCEKCYRPCLNTPSVANTVLWKFMLFGLAKKLIRGPPATQIKHCACCKRIFLRYQPSDHRADFLHFQKATAWNFAKHVVDMLLRHLVEDTSASCRRCDAIHRDVVSGGFLAKRL